MSNIIIIDNFLSNTDFDMATQIIKSKQWNYGHTSGGREKVNTPFWDIALNNEFFFTQHMVAIIEQKLNKKFKLHRVYANGQTYGQNGSYHQDESYETNPPFITACLYAHQINLDDIETVGGNLYIKVPNKQYITCIESAANRMVIFPSTYYHKGMAFSRYSTEMRICVAFKMQEII